LGDSDFGENENEEREIDFEHIDLVWERETSLFEDISPSET